MHFTADWIDAAQNAVPEERATVADFRAFLANANVCKHMSGDGIADHVTVALYPLAGAIASNWWRLFGGRDWQLNFADYRGGYIIPEIRVSYDGVVCDINVEQKSYFDPDIRFWAVPGEMHSRTETEDDLSRIVETVLERLSSNGMPETGAAMRWARVQSSRLDPEETTYCEAAGALGVDPYRIDDQSASAIDQATRHFEDEPLNEFLSGANTLNAIELIQWVERMRGRPKYTALLGNLKDVAKEIGHPTLMPKNAWELGYAQSRALRHHLKLTSTARFRSYKVLAKYFGASDYFKLAPQVDGIRLLREDRDDGICLHMRNLGKSQGSSAHLYTLARGIGDAICFPKEAVAPVNHLHKAYRQAAGRAFAAEFLAPLDEIRSMYEDGKDTETMAEEFGVSPAVIERQIENAPRRGVFSLTS